MTGPSQTGGAGTPGRWAHAWGKGWECSGWKVWPYPRSRSTSAAARTSETAELVADGMAAPLLIESYRSMYEGGTETILQYVRELDDGVISAMVVGHNPTIYRLTWGLLATDGAVGSGLGSASNGESGSDAESGSDGESGSDAGGELDGRHRLEEHGFPTCTVAVMVLPISSWSETNEESSSLAGVFSPPY